MLEAREVRLRVLVRRGQVDTCPGPFQVASHVLLPLFLICRGWLVRILAGQGVLLKLAFGAGLL